MGDDRQEYEAQVVGTPPPALGLERQPLWTRHETNTIGA